MIEREEVLLWAPAARGCSIEGGRNLDPDSQGHRNLQSWAQRRLEGGRRAGEGSKKRRWACGPGKFGGHGCSLELCIVIGGERGRRVLWILSHLSHQCIPAGKHPSPACGLSGHP